MMGTSCFEEEQDHFFDSREDVASMSDSGSDCFENCDSTNIGSLEWVSSNFHYEVWIEIPDSVLERRHRFLKWMGLDLGLDHSQRRDSFRLSREIVPDVNRIMETGSAVLGNSGYESGFSSSLSSVSSWSEDTPELSEDGGLGGNFMCRIKNLDNGKEFIVDELGEDGTFSRLREVGSDRLVTADEFHRTLGLSALVQQFMRREVEEASRKVADASNSDRIVKRVKKGWLRKLGALSCLVDREGKEGTGDEVCRVRVRAYRKRSKELSALYMGQEIRAHKGSILTMKFSPDGQYLASAGEDCVVRVWQVIERARTDDGDIPDSDPSCMYFTVNSSSELAPAFTDKEKMSKCKSTRKTLDSACVILPPKIFQLCEKPLHEFCGHEGDVLDLSWSNNKYLLSSSVDKTVRLWQVGCDGWLKVFSHNNYVTCVQFNPVDDNYFISGSIDGKVRIWGIPGCQVVDWTDIREIVTAVCYRPDGQGGIIGSMTGNCRFFESLGNHLQLDGQICLQGKRKSPWKRITGFQFCPSNPRKLMVTSADSLVRILDGVDVICKYRGIRNTGSQISATFTSDGGHVISASEDSNVYVWNYNSQDGPKNNYGKSVWSCERFLSSNVSVAIPWCGMKSGNSFPITIETLASHQQLLKDPMGRVSENGCHCHLIFSPSPGFFSEALPKGSATWPEEKLPTSSPLTLSSSICKSQYKFLKTSCQNTVTSPHAWGLVIVTASWDGQIRSFHNYGLPIRL